MCGFVSANQRVACDSFILLESLSQGMEQPSSLNTEEEPRALEGEAWPGKEREATRPKLSVIGRQRKCRNLFALVALERTDLSSTADSSPCLGQ